MKLHYGALDEIAAHVGPQLLSRLTDIVVRSPDAKTLGDAFAAELVKSHVVDWARVSLAGETGDGEDLASPRYKSRYDLLVRAMTVVENEPPAEVCRELGCPGRAVAVIWLPLMDGPQVSGVLIVANLTKTDPGKQLPGLQYLAGLLSLAVQAKRLRRETETTQRQDAAWNNFVDLLVHELKTSLTTIVSSAGLLKEETDDADELKLRLVQNLADSVANLDATIAELPNIVRARRRPLPAPEDYIAVGPVLREAAAQVKPLAAKRQQQLTLQCPRSLPGVAMGQGQLKQIIINLLTNAVETTPTSGEIGLQAKAAEDSVVIKVSDGAPPIPGERHRELLEPAHWLDVDTRWLPRQRFRVAVAKLLAETYGGRLRLESQPGYGNTFALRLPPGRAAQPTDGIDGGGE